MIPLLLAGILAFSAAPARAEEGAFNLGCFLGLNDADTPATLGQCDAQDILNTESNLDGTAILKRKGFSKFADLTISTSPVTGSHSFIDSSGNRIDIVCQDRNCAKSTNGNAFATFLTTAASGITRWSFVDQGGILYGGNNKYDPIMKYDGTTRTSPAGIPLGSILELTQDRLAVGDISGNPNRVHYSSAGSYENFTVGVNSEDSFFDDIGTPGDKVRGIKCIAGGCLIFKTSSITSCDMADQYNTRCSVISPNLGTTDPASIVAVGSDLYFRAQDKSYWRIGASGLDQISKKIPNFIKSQSGGLGGGENTNTQTTQADWNAGAQLPTSSWNTTTTNGSIFPSSTTFLDTSSTNFAAGTLSSLSATDSIGEIRLSSTVFEDNFSDGNFTSNPAWSTDAATWDIQSNHLLASAGTSSNNIWTASTLSTGSFSFGMSANNGANSFTKFMSLGTSFASSNGYAIRASAQAPTPELSVYLLRYPGATVLGSLVAFAVASPEDRFTYSVHRTSAGVFSVFITTGSSPNLIITATDTNYSSSTHVMLQAEAAGATWDDLYFLQYSTFGTITSRIYDTAFSTTIGGTVAISSSVPTGSSLTFSIRSSSSPNNDVWGGWTAFTNSNTTKINEVNRYWQYISTFSTPYSTQTPSIQDVSLIAATTGQFRTQCIQPNSSISAWGTLSCAQTIVGGGSDVFYATSAATCGALPTTHPVNAAGAVQSGWTAQTNNATLSITTNTAVYIGFRSLLGSSTDQAQVDACTLAWNEGTPAQPSWAVYDSIKQAIYWTTTINNFTSSNRLLKYDLNLKEWYPFDIPAQAPRVINNTLYFGGASSGTWNTYGLVDADAGNSINAYWKSKDIGSDKPFQEKDFKTLSILNRNQGTGSMTGTWTNSIGTTGSYTISLSTGTGITYARSNYFLPKQSPQQFMNIKIGNNSATPFEVLGIGLTWSVLPWKVAP